MGRATRRSPAAGSTDFQLILTTCPDAATAERIAEALVNDRLAACVNIIAIGQSVYRWRGRVEKSPEQLLIIKTRKTDLAGVKRALAGLHPYELPELITVPITGGSSEYLKWLANPDSVA